MSATSIIVNYSSSSCIVYRRSEAYVYFYAFSDRDWQIKILTFTLGSFLCFLLSFVELCFDPNAAKDKAYAQPLHAGQ
jgi:hypothetical protein